MTIMSNLYRTRFIPGTMFWLLLLVIAAYWFIDWIVRIPCLPSGSIKKKFVLITGCDSGFGRVAAKMLDEKGFHVFATCMTEEGEEQLQVELPSP